MSGEMGWNAPGSGRDSRISKRVKPLAGRASALRLSTRASGGSSPRRAAVKPASAAAGPSTTMSTPAEVLRTQPVSA